MPRFRTLALIYGLALLIWTQIEDNAVLPVTLYGLAMSLLLVRRWLEQHPLPAQHRFLTVPLLGAITGMGASLATAALMVLKTGLHSHLFPDYPPGQILGILERAPVWTVTGALAGLGLYLAVIALRPQIYKPTNMD